MDFLKYFVDYNPVQSINVYSNLNSESIYNSIPDNYSSPSINYQFPIFTNTEEEKISVYPEPQQTEQTQPTQEQQVTKQPEEVKVRSFQSNSKVIDNIIDIGRKEVGKGYHTGTHGPKTYDCSGFVYYMFNKGGIKVPLNIFQLTKFGQTVSSLKDAQKGDMIVTPGKGQSGLHVKVISKIENGQIYVLEAAGKKVGVVERKLTNTNNIKSIRRFV